MELSLKQRMEQLRSEGKKYKEIKDILNCSMGLITYYLTPQGKIKNVTRKRNSRYARKKEYKNSLGGKCQVCGYNKCQKALHFHHIDPKTKNFAISEALRKSYPQQEVWEEIKKCILVCANCHVEIHDGLIDYTCLGLIHQSSNGSPETQQTSG